MIGRLMNVGLRLRRLSWVQRRRLIEAAVLMPLAAVSVRLAGLQRTLRLLSALPGGRTTVRDDRIALAIANDTARLVQIAAGRGLYHAPCLPRSLTLWSLLRRQGVAAELRIGVRKEGGRLLGHAWVECRGRVVGDDGDIAQRFASFDGIDETLSAVPITGDR